MENPLLIADAGDAVMDVWPSVYMEAPVVRDVVTGALAIVSGLLGLLYSTLSKRIDEKADKVVMDVRTEALTRSLDEHKREFGAFLSKFHDRSADETAQFRRIVELINEHHIVLLTAIATKADRKDA